MKKSFMLLNFLLASTMGLLYADSNPTMSRVYGNQFTSAIYQTQSAATIGTLDSTFGNSGSVTVNSLLSGGTAQAMQALPNGNFLVVVTKLGSNAVVGEFNAQGVLEASYGNAGVTTLGILSISTPLATMCDTQSRLLIAGGNSGGNAGVIYRLPVAGSTSTVSPLVSDSNFTYIAGVAQQTSGKIIAVGFNGTNAIIARYNLDGSLDTSFGPSSGYCIFNGASGRPQSTNGLYSVLVDASDNIYVLYANTSSSVFIAKLNASGLYQSNINSTEILGLHGVNASNMRMAYDINNNFIIAGVSAGGTGGVTPASGALYVTGLTSLGVAPSNWSDYTSSSINNVLGALITSSGYGSTGSNGYIYIASVDSNLLKQQVTCLMGNGSLDSSSNDTSGNNFNTSGYNLFNTVTIASSALPGMTLAVDGQIYVCGQETTSTPTTTPYVYRFNNNQYVYQPAQFPAAQEQGTLDQTFGNTAIETYAGVTTPYNGLYGSLLKQQIAAAIEVTAGSTTTGDIVLGMNGLLTSSANSNMMLAWLNSQGQIDTSVGTNGYKNLTNVTSTNEYLSSIIQDGLGNLYIAGYTSVTDGGSSASAIVRAYSSTGSSLWSASQATSGYKGVGISIQDRRTLLCVAESSTVGHISSYISGILDNSFGDAGSGTISPTSFSLHMGPCYNLAINNDAFIYAAYVDSSNQQVTLVKFLPNGSGLLSSFGTSGIISNIFNSYTVAPDSVRVGFDASGNIVVAATGYTTGGSAATDFLLACYDPITGSAVETFNGGSPLVVPVTGATGLTLTRLTCVSDGKLLLTGWDDATDDAMIIARITAAGVLDITFNSQGDTVLSATAQPGVLSIKIGDKVAGYNARVATSAVVQSTAGANQGNIVLVGYEAVTSSDATPMAMRVYGTSGTTEVLDYSLQDLTPGVLETAYNLYSSPNISAGFGNVICVYPSTNTNNGKVLVGIDNGTTSLVARLNVSGMTLDASFGTSGVYTITGSLTGISHISIDAQNNILVGGQIDGAGWATVINNAGSLQTNFNMTSTNIASVNNILQQKSGRYIVAATESISGKGMLVAFKNALVSSATSLEVDPTFNPLSVDSALYAGSYYVSTNGLYAIAINTNDTIVAAYANTATPKKVVVTEITANGSGTVSGFNSGSTVTSDVSTDSSAVVQLDVDSVGNIVVGASYNNGSTHQVQIQRFDSTGGASTAFTGLDVSGGVQTIASPELGSAGVTLTGLMETATQQTILTGYNSDGGNGPLFASRLLNDGSLDTSWNTTPTSPDLAGVLTYTSNGAVNINNAAIAVDGTLLSIGSTNATATLSNPIVTYIYGDPLVTQVSQNPLAQAAGVVDTTIPASISGALPLASLPTGGSVPGIPARIYIYNTLDAQTNPSPNGAILIASADSSNAYVTLLNADLSLCSSFGSSGRVTIPVSNITITDLYVANGTNETTQPIYMTGYTSGNVPWAAKISFDGTSSIVVSPSSALTMVNGIRESSNSRILMAGYNGSSGAIVAYNSSMTAIDTSFGNNNGTGYYTTGVANSVAAMVTDSSDRIYVAYKNGSAITVQRLLENGTAVDSTFSATFTTAINSYSTSQIKMAIDLTNAQLVVAAQDGNSAGNIIQVKRFNLSNGGSAGNISTITVSGAALNLADLFIDNDQNMYVIGYISSGTGSGKAIIARVVSQSSTVIALDTTYANTATPQGVANVSIGAMSVVTAGMLDPDKRVYLVGSNGSTTAYMGRLFGDNYWNEISQATLQGQVGTLDLTLNPNFTGGIDLSTLSGWSSLSGGYKAQAIIENVTGDGTCYIAFGNDTNVILGKLNADMTPVSSFGSSGLTTAVAMATVNSITTDSLGNIIVAGTNSSLQKVLVYNSSGALQATSATATPSGNLTIGTTVVQQKSGRYLVGGYLNAYGGTGVIAAFESSYGISNPGNSGVLPVDQTFGPSAYYGFYPTLVNTQIDDICIDANDNIYFIYRDVSTNEVILGKLIANGSALANASNCSAGAFNGGEVVNTGIVTTEKPCIAINSAGNILVGAQVSFGVTTQLYNGSTGAAIDAGEVVVESTNSPVLTKLVASGTEFYGSIYDTTPVMTAFAITNTGTLDSSFGSSGLMTTTVQSAVQVKSLSVQYDGKLVMVGYNNAGVGSTADPVLIRGYGYPYVAQYNQAPMKATCGTLDTTIWPSSGAFSLSSISGLSVSTDALTKINPVTTTQSFGGFTITSDHNSSSATTIFQLAKDFTLRTTYFGSAGYYTWSSGHGGTTGLFTNPYVQNRSPYRESVYLVGNNPNVAGAAGTWAEGIVYKIDGTGYFSNELRASNFMASVQAVNQQSNGRVLVAGLGDVTLQGNTHGYIIGLTKTGSTDVSFASNATHPGMLDMGTSTAITDLTIDAYDNIIAVSNNAGLVVLQKVTASGLGSIVTSAGTPITSAVSGSNIQVALDSNGYIIVAAATATGFIARSYNNDSTLSDNTLSALEVNVGTSSPSWVLGNMYTTSDGKVTLVGYDSASDSSTAGQMFVARLVSGANSLLLDHSTFNPNSTPGYLITSVGSMNQFNDAIIDADACIYVVGSNSSSPTPYMTRISGDSYVSQQSQSLAGVPGTLDVSFGSDTPPTGYYNISTLGSGALNNGRGVAILATSDGGYYEVIDNETNSLLYKTLTNGSLDTSFNSGAVNYDAGIAQSTAPTGTSFMMMDGGSHILLVGTNGSGGFVQRYQANSTGSIDTTFGSSGVLSVGASTTATVAVEQTLARLVVAGKNAAGNGALFAYKSLAPHGTPGTVDTTFNSTGTFSTGVANVIPTLIADSYDRLIFASLNSAGTAIDLYRLTPTGQLDITFGSNGKVANALTTNIGGISVNYSTSIQVALDSNGNIVLAAYTYNAGMLTDAISIKAYDNGIATTAGANGNVYTNQYTLTNLNGILQTGMSLKSIVTAADGTVLLLGNCTGASSATSPSWIARFANTSYGGTYALDTTFNPNGTQPGLFKYTNTAGTINPYNVYNAMVINAIGGLGVIGYEKTGASAYTPSIIQLNDSPYTSAQVQSPDSKAVGSNDRTLGVSSIATSNQGIIFYGNSVSTSSSNQVARAVGLYDNNNIVVAIDGTNPAAPVGVNTSIFVNMFDNDGILNPNFRTSGQATVLQYYQNQYVKDMITFTTVSGVHKAILAGYGTDTTLNVTGSLVLQYTLTPGSNSIDTSFGGFDGNPSGVAFGDGKQAFVVGQQTLGRIVVGGLAQNGAGLLLGYTANGKLDRTFGNDGYQTTNTGSTGIYTHAIDLENRIIIAYNDGSGNVAVSRFLPDGSALDTTFGTAGSVTIKISGLQTGVNNNLKVALDNSGNIIVAAVTGNGTTSNIIKVYSYSSDGSSTNYTSSFTGGTSFPGSSSSRFTIGSLLIDEMANAVIVAYDENPSPNTILVTRVTSAGSLDTTFNVVGYMTYQVASGITQVATDALIHPDGRLIIVGNEQ